jgi:hypothetical protein
MAFIVLLGFRGIFGFAYSPYFLAVSAPLKPADMLKLADGKGYKFYAWF